jgi:hypothetical protein
VATVGGGGGGDGGGIPFPKTFELDILGEMLFYPAVIHFVVENDFKCLNLSNKEVFDKFKRCGCCAATLYY